VFLLVPAHLGSPGQRAIKRLLLLCVVVYCGQTAGQIKLLLVTKVDLGACHTVLDGEPAPPKGAQQPPSFRSMSIVAKWLDGSRCHLVQR